MNHQSRASSSHQTILRRRISTPVSALFLFRGTLGASMKIDTPKQGASKEGCQFSALQKSSHMTHLHKLFHFLLCANHTYQNKQNLFQKGEILNKILKKADVSDSLLLHSVMALCTSVQGRADAHYDARLRVTHLTYISNCLKEWSNRFSKKKNLTKDIFKQFYFAKKTKKSWFQACHFSGNYVSVLSGSSPGLIIHHLLACLSLAGSTILPQHYTVACLNPIKLSLTVSANFHHTNCSSPDKKINDRCLTAPIIITKKDFTFVVKPPTSSSPVWPWLFFSRCQDLIIQPAAPQVECPDSRYENIAHTNIMLLMTELIKKKFIPDPSEQVTDMMGLAGLLSTMSHQYHQPLYYLSRPLVCTYRYQSSCYIKHTAILTTKNCRQNSIGFFDSRISSGGPREDWGYGRKENIHEFSQRSQGNHRHFFIWTCFRSQELSRGGDGIKTLCRALLNIFNDGSRNRIA
ncbi:hypothetical protein VP01_2443g1 [Puccinia sorghi]|uniref:Uncharacterized protein n=1 Tax=Puccinia sorghi TaxID=27349 RepID=A0A0L6V699_9BASI|nr:hypothetical protein VP01_2443g1 [Puccinia sorghi]